MVETIAELFYQALKHDLPNALTRKVGSTTVPLSHQEVEAQVERLALALYDLGLRPGDAVAILSENRTKWAIADYACAISGLPSVPVYPTLNPAQTGYILKDSHARMVICSNREQLSKILHEWPTLLNLQMAILLDGELPDTHGHPVVRWDDLRIDQDTQDERRFEVRNWAAARKPSDLLTIIYTSGTTADPKGAMLTHGNLVSDILGALRYFTLYRGESCLSVLPLSHIYERMAGHYLMFYCGVTIHYADSFLSLAQDLQEVRPHILLAVPRIFEKVYARVRDTAVMGGFFKRAILGWTIHVGRHASQYRFRDQQPPFWVRLPLAVADLLVYRKVRARTGGRIRLAISGGAALNPKVNEFFWAMGVPIYEGYGLSETSPIVAVTRPGHVRPGYVGHPIWEEWDGKPFMKLAEDGEILVRGPNVMLGYWQNEAATREAMDADGYFHTGDIGELDEAGRLKITDRKKELLVTSGGKNIAPQPIENLLRADKYIEQAVLIGDHRNFISALIVPHFPTLRYWAEHKHLRFKDNAELITLPQVKAKLQRHVEHVNVKLSKHERVRKIILLEEELTPESGLLTPSLKVKRRAVNLAFKDRIEAIYANSNVDLN